MTYLAGKTAIITGGGRGIGAAVALALATKGAAVALTYRSDRDAAERTAARIAEAGGTATIWQADHGDDAGTARVVTDIAAHIGAIDILVNNAGIFSFGEIGEVAVADLDAALAVHVKAPFVAIRAALPAMPDGGRIITIGSSLGGHVPSAGLSVYATSKAALVGLTKALARELGPRAITVNLVNPGSIDTDMNPADGPQADDERALIPLGRYGQTREIAAAVAYLASPEAAFVSGAMLAVDGGVTA